MSGADAPTGTDVDDDDDDGAGGEAGVAAPALAGSPGDDDYVVEAELARGGMGRILAARDVRHDRRVAIKVLLRPGPAAARRFEREARLTAGLSHPGVVPVYRIGRWTDGEPFFAMKLVAGAPLADRVAAAGALAGRLALLGHVVAATEALAHAHRRGVVHRDLKPQNVLCGDFGETVVIDWGLARLLDEPDEDAGRALGTPRYMPPEQARGGGGDPRGDVYALGALLYHVLCGAPPYPGDADARATLAQLAAGPPEPIAERAPGLPVDLVAIVEKAMARAPADRYPDAAALAADLRAFVAGGRVTAHAYSAPLLLARWARRHRAVVAAAMVAAVTLALVTGLAARRIVAERDRAQAARAVAEEARAEAEAERAAADALAGHVASDLRARLTALGRLDALEALARAVAGYDAAVGPRRP